MSILKDIESYIASGESDSEKLGLEIEHFVVNDEGVQIGFEEVSGLIEEIAGKISAENIVIDGHVAGYIADDHTVTLEPSCQFEISIAPYPDIESIGRVYDRFIKLWEPVFLERGYHIVTAGNLPSVEAGLVDPDDIPLSPKKRYKYMDSHFRETGRFGKYMMRASASTQVSVDYSSEADMVRKLQVLQKLSPLFMILMENKNYPDSFLQGNEEKKHLLRIQEWEDLDDARTGFIPGSFDKDFGYKYIAEAVYNTPLILLTENGETSDVGYKTAKELVSEGRISRESGENDIDELDGKEKTALIEHFISMGFFHFRIKKYIEIRVADSVSKDKALGYAAFIKGLIYSKDSLLRLVDKTSKITEEDVYKAIDSIERDGFDAVIYEGRTAGEWASCLLWLAKKNLPTSEKVYIDHLRNAKTIPEYVCHDSF